MDPHLDRVQVFAQGPYFRDQTLQRALADTLLDHFALPRRPMEAVREQAARQLVRERPRSRRRRGGSSRLHSALCFIRDAAAELGIGEVVELVPQSGDPKDLFGLLQREYIPA